MTRKNSNPTIAYAGVLLGVFIIVLDTTIVNVAAPRIQEGLHSTITEVQWVVNGYNLMFAALLLSAGAAADRFGGRRVFTVGLAVFGIASLACGFAPSAAILISSRALQGAGAALMLPTALALAGHLYSEQTARARAFGRWAAVAGAATVLGPLAGGLLVDSLGWRAIFFVNVPIAVLSWLLLTLNAPETALHSHSFDLSGQLLGMVTLASAAIALTEAGSQGWNSPVVLATLVVTVVAAAAMVAVERRAAEPMVPPGLVTNRQFSAASLVGLILSVGIYGQLFVLSLYFQEARHFTASGTGLALLPFAAVTTVGPLFAGRLIGRGWVTGTLLFGQVAGAAASLLLAFADTGTPYWTVAIGLALLGLCQSACQPAVASAALIDAPRQYAGVASGVLTATRQVGSVLGVALLGGLVSEQRSLLPGMHAALLIVTTLFVAGSLLTALFIRAHQKPTDQASRHKTATTST